MQKKQRLPILCVVETGNPEFERYLIEDEQKRVWTGHEFGRNGVLFADHNQAAIAVQDILKGHFKGVEPQRYSVPLFVEVYSKEPIGIAEVAKYLSVSARLYLNTPDHGNGPGSSLVTSCIQWHRIAPERMLNA